MQYKKHLQAINIDLKEFVGNASWLLETDIGKKKLMEDITRQYNRLIDPNTPKDQLRAVYQLLASYAVLGLIGEMDDAIVRGLQENP